MDYDDLPVAFDASSHWNKINNMSAHILPMKDWLAIQSIQSSYLLAFQHQSIPDS
jgi:hypothetical protein